MMVLLAEAVSGEGGSNLPASRAPEPQLWGSPQRVDKAKLPVQSVCVFCNLHKGPNLAGIDPVTKKLTGLFNPRLQRWTRHFRWEGPLLIGKTAQGRTTIEVLAMNDPDRIALRQELLAQGLLPRE